MEYVPDCLKHVVLRCAPAAATDWYERNWLAAGRDMGTMALRAAFAGAGRRLGVGTAALAAPERERLLEAGIVAPETWTLSDFGRAGLLTRALGGIPRGGHVDLVRELHQRGDYREQGAVLRSLMLLEEPARFLDVAIDACRTNVLDVFEAIACENAYPASHFPDPNFNQLVLKAIFMGLPVNRIDSFSGRDTPELRRMIADFASERRAAGRPVSEDVTLLLSQ